MISCCQRYCHYYLFALFCAESALRTHPVLLNFQDNFLFINGYSVSKSAENLGYLIILQNQRFCVVEDGNNWSALP